MQKNIKRTCWGFIFGMAALVLIARAVHSEGLQLGTAPSPTTLQKIPLTLDQIVRVSTRFQLAMDGKAVLDKDTGLVWERSPDSSSSRDWDSAKTFCSKRSVGGQLGWRLPTLKELASLVDTKATSSPALSRSHPFINIKSSFYWSADTVANSASSVWGVNLGSGTLNSLDMMETVLAWCVRGGQGVDLQ